ncbi:MAG TPA: FAD-dependent oxidoreductase [Pseudolabrys sp.]|jgi:pyruvate/2-oxoglutarate dehydrogenase complex dihydrolipoamide dehydrogenase (E3) component
MAETLAPDICVIGGGPGGLSVAAAAAALGVPTVLIEKHKTGGDSLNTGSVPSKTFLASAKRADMLRNAKVFGLDARDVGVNFTDVQRRVHSVIAAISPAYSSERFTGLGVRLIHAHAKFKDRRTVIADGIEIRARRFVVATGSVPALPPIRGLDSGPYFTNETIFEVKERPGHLIIIGAGATGLELAQGFRRLGSSVTVLESAEPLGEDDAECAAIVLTELEREGVVVRSGVTVVRIAHAGGTVTATIETGGAEQTITGSHLLIAAGRSPAIAGLDLGAAGIRHDHSGIIVNRGLKTTNRRIYAIGDCTAGALQFTHAANYHADLVIRNALFRLPVRLNNDCVPWVTYTDPELAQVGLTETRARERNMKIHVARWPYYDNDRAQAEGETRGHIKVITTQKGTIVGVTIVGVQAGELIAMWALAVTRSLNIRDLTKVVLPYPTLSELGKRAAIDYFTPNLTGTWVRRIIAWLRIFG